MLIAYNRKTKKGLSWSKLYSGRKKPPMDEDFDMIEEEEEEYQQEDLEY